MDDEGEHTLHPGDCAGFKAGLRNGHCFQNRSNGDVALLVVGSGTTGITASIRTSTWPLRRVAIPALGVTGKRTARATDGSQLDAEGVAQTLQDVGLRSWATEADSHRGGHSVAPRATRNRRRRGLLRWQRSRGAADPHGGRRYVRRARAGARERVGWSKVSIRSRARSPRPCAPCLRARR